MPLFAISVSFEYKCQEGLLKACHSGREDKAAPMHQRGAFLPILLLMAALTVGGQGVNAVGVELQIHSQAFHCCTLCRHLRVLCLILPRGKRRWLRMNSASVENRGTLDMDPDLRPSVLSSL